MNKNPLTIWDKLQVEIAEKISKQSTDILSSSKKKFNSKAICFLGTLFGLIFWMYTLIQVVFFDIDSYLIRMTPPSIASVVYYKFFVFLLITALFALFIKNYFWVYVYILFFPLIILFWEIPKIVYKLKSWILFLCLTEIACSFFYKPRFRILTITLALFSFLFIIIFHSKPIVGLFTLILTTILLISFMRTIYMSFKTSIFFKFQAELISKFRHSSFTRKVILIDEKIKNNKDIKLTKEQSNVFLMNLQMGLLLHKAIHFWAYQLEKYRTSNVSFLFSGVSYIWLFVKLILILSFINYGLYKVDPNLFIAKSTSFVTFTNYTLNSLFLNETSQLIASGDIITFIRIISGIMGYLLFGVLIINFIYVARQTKGDHDLTETIKSVKNEAHELEKLIKEEYDVTTSEALKKLQEFKGALLTLILKISSQVPADYK